MKVSRRWWLGLTVLIGAAAGGTVVADPAPVDAAGPDLELLEYLGGLVSDDDDEWVGPDDMQGALDTSDHAAFPDDVPATAEIERQ